MKKTQYKILAVIASFVLPLTASAAPAFTGLKGFLVSFGGLINTSIRILFGLSLLFFFWGVAQFIAHAGDAKTRDEGKKKIVWGIVALFVFLSIYGIIRFIGGTLNIQSGGTIDPLTGQIIPASSSFQTSESFNSFTPCTDPYADNGGAVCP